MIYDIILAPVVSEKATNIADKNGQIVFKVVKDATKLQVLKAVETCFGVKVTAVNMLNVKPKVKRFRATVGQRKGWKKAIVTLEKGQDIDFSKFS